MPTPKRISGRDHPEFRRFLAVKARKNRDLILVEGPKLLREALRSHLKVALIALGAAGEDVPELEAPRVHFSPALMKSLSEVETHQGLIALVERPRPARSFLTAPAAFVLLLDAVQDPGNVGTLFRTAEAAGVIGVLMTRGCADPLSPKALRASAGSVFRMPHSGDLSVAEALNLLTPKIPVMAAAPGPGSVSLFDAPVRLPLALALGSEGLGLSPALVAKAALRVRIPMVAVESLNVAAAGAVALFEIARRAGILGGTLL